MFARYRKNGGQVLGVTSEPSGSLADMGWVGSSLVGICEFASYPGGFDPTKQQLHCDSVKVTISTAEQIAGYAAAEAADAVTEAKEDAKALLDGDTPICRVLRAAIGAANVDTIKAAIDAG